MSTTYVPLGRVIDSPHQARIGVGDVESLAQTILQYGLRQLPEARLVEGGVPVTSLTSHTEARGGEWYLSEDSHALVQLASGHRRVEAVRWLHDDETVTEADLESAGLVPGYIAVDLQHLTDDEMLDILTIENAQREDLSAIEQARLIDSHTEAGRSGAEIAAVFGKSESWVSNRRRLLELPREVQVHTHDGQLSVRQAMALVPLYDLDPEIEAHLPGDARGAELSRISIFRAARRGELTSDEIRRRVEAALEFARKSRSADGESERPSLDDRDLDPPATEAESSWSEVVSVSATRQGRGLYQHSADPSEGSEDPPETTDDDDLDEPAGTRTEPADESDDAEDPDLAETTGAPDPPIDEDLGANIERLIAEASGTYSQASRLAAALHNLVVEIEDEIADPPPPIEHALQSARHTYKQVTGDEIDARERGAADCKDREALADAGIHLGEARELLACDVSGVRDLAAHVAVPTLLVAQRCAEPRRKETIAAYLRDHTDHIDPPDDYEHARPWLRDAIDIACSRLKRRE